MFSDLGVGQLAVIGESDGFSLFFRERGQRGSHARRVDPRTGIQLGYTSYILQWQHGKQVIVYPGNVAHGKPVVPFPAWSSR